jgi:hypothetical protein
MKKKFKKVKLKDTKSTKKRKKKLSHYGYVKEAATGGFVLASIERHWDKEKTVKQNYDKLGLSTLANKAIPIKQPTEEADLDETKGFVVCFVVKTLSVCFNFLSLPFLSFLELPPAPAKGELAEGLCVLNSFFPNHFVSYFCCSSWTELDAITNAPKPAPYVVKSMAVYEQKICSDLMKKYKEDYEAMARDIDINVYQMTPAQLKKRIALYKELLAL